MKLKGLDIILTYDCTGRCAYSCYRAGPDRAETMRAAEVEGYLAAEAVAEEARAMYLAFFDAVIDLSFIVMPLIVGFVAGFGESLPFLVCALFLAGSGMLFRLTRI